MKGAVTAPEAAPAAGPGEARRITAAAAINHSTYFLQSPLSPDGRTLLFISNRSGAWQLYSIDPFPEGPVRQWTAGAPIHPFSPAFDASGHTVYFVRGGAVWAIDRDSLAERLIVEFAGGQLGEVSLSADGRHLTVAVRVNGANGIAVGGVDGEGWHVIEFPRTVIHPQFHPLDPEWIEFAGDPAPRMHRVRRDGSGLECLYEHGNDEFVVHETFLGQTGDLVYTVWPHALWRMDWQTRERHKICDFNAWHITPNRTGTQVLCATNHPDRGLHLIDTDTGAARFLCHSRASGAGTQWRTSRYALAEDFARARSEAGRGALSWMETATDTVYGPQWTHPHPAFSRCERWVFYTSDESGHPQVYALRLSDG
jgi:oligogalacturonide lyase